jgi:predicted RNA-binding protein with EMAP domain
MNSPTTSTKLKSLLTQTQSDLNEFTWDYHPIQVLVDFKELYNYVLSISNIEETIKTKYRENKDILSLCEQCIWVYFIHVDEDTKPRYASIVFSIDRLIEEIFSSDSKSKHEDILNSIFDKILEILKSRIPTFSSKDFDCVLNITHVRQLIFNISIEAKILKK